MLPAPSSPGLSCLIYRGRVQRSDGETYPLVVKSAKEGPSDLAAAAALGLPREAFFYTHLAPALRGSGVGGGVLSVGLPAVFLSYGDLDRGAKVVVMEDLEAAGGVQAGLLFGPGSPLNWGRDLAAAAASAGPAASAEVVAAVAFTAAAALHAAHWRNVELLDKPYLRGSDWLAGLGESSWNAAQVRPTH